MRKAQAVRGHAKPWGHQVITVHQVPKKDRPTPPAQSWWTAHAGPSAPPRSAFVAEVERRQVERVDAPRKAHSPTGWVDKPQSPRLKPEPRG